MHNYIKLWDGNIAGGNKTRKPGKQCQNADLPVGRIKNKLNKAIYWRLNFCISSEKTVKNHNKTQPKDKHSQNLKI